MAKEGAASVENVDVLHKALEAAMTRIQEMAPKMGQTLVDAVPGDIWANWDASSQKALVSDVAGFEAEGEDSFDEVPAAA